MNSSEAWDFSLLALCIWRETRGELLSTKLAQAWSIRNRVLRPGWWGHGWASVVLMPFQYSSFNPGDPNATKFPHANDPTWLDSLAVAAQVFEAPVTPDPTSGADSYFDMSLDTDPPSWAKDGSKVKTCDWGRLHFYRTI